MRLPLRLVVVAVGRLRIPWAQAACSDYGERLKHRFKFELVEVKEADRRGGSKDVSRQKEDEAVSIWAAVPTGATVLALDERGLSFTSTQLAAFVDDAANRSKSALCLLVGGPDGHTDATRERADRLWSLGTLTLPHELARIVLLEQLYRAATINAGEPYHRA